MKTMQIVRLTMIALLVLSARAAGAAAPAGDYDLHFTGNNNVYDISGTYDEDIDEVFDDLSVTFNVDSAGKITGSGSVTGTVFDPGSGVSVFLNGTINITGSIKSAGDLTRVQLKYAMSGTGTASVDGQVFPVQFSASFSFKLEINEAFHEALGSIKGNVKVKIFLPDGSSESASESIPEESFALSLRGNTDGDWELELDDLQVVDGRITGIGEVQFDSSRRIPVVLTGSYSPTKDVAKLKLQSGSSKLQVECREQAGELILIKLSGKLIGQKVSLQAVQ